MLSIPVPRISTTKQSLEVKAYVFAKATSLRHIFASRAAELTLQLLLLAGNTGLNMGNPLERCHRDALCGRIHAPHSDLIRRNAGQKSLAF
ncbi:hypothetical protein [Gluconobacter cerinus]|uniref:hypothetical protein n=1 Tax=Gluconobacter cerinus TaxID=38307 RepID=UPI0011AED40D|nr:hypothetical protein [Gluconobacter cerinus]